MNSTQRPRPPPKPSHLATVRTGNINTEAFRTYIRQHREDNQSRQGHAVKLSKVKHRSERGTEGSYDTCADSRSEDSDEDDKWRTAKQPTGSSHQHPALADMFKRASETHQSDSNSTVKSSYRTQQLASTICEEKQDAAASSVPVKEPSSGLSRDALDRLESLPMNGFVTESTSCQDVEETQQSDENATTEPTGVQETTPKVSNGDDTTHTCDPQKEIEAKLKGTAESSAANSRAAQQKSRNEASSATSADDSDSVPRDDEAILMPSREGLPTTFNTLPTLRLTPFPANTSDGTTSTVPSGLKLYCESDGSRNETALPRASATTPLSSKSSRFLARRPQGREARALYDFEGQAQNELTLSAGQTFVILSEDKISKWTCAATEFEGVWTKGLVPIGWYTLVQDMARARSLEASPNSSSQHAVTRPARLESPRPASGVGEMLKSPPDGPTALDKLTKVSQAIQAPHEEAGRCAAQPKAGSSQAQCSLDLASDKDSGSLVILRDIPFDASKSVVASRFLSRASTFVTSGAAKYILSKSEGSNSMYDGGDLHRIVGGDHGMPCWRTADVQVSTQVCSPEMAEDATGQGYVAYLVHSSFVFECDNDSKLSMAWRNPRRIPEDPSATSGVFRRYNQFRWLAEHLLRYYPFLMQCLPPFPSAHHALTRSARFEASLVQSRRKHLGAWLTAVSRHPVLSQTPAVRFFLDSEEEEELWLQEARRVEDDLKRDTHGHLDIDLLFRQTQQSYLGFDADEARQELEHSSKFAAAYERGMASPTKSVLKAYHDLRQSASSEADRYRQLSCSILRLITGFGDNASRNKDAIGKGKETLGWHNLNLPPMGRIGVRDDSGATNEERAWCWREGCQDCHRLTRAMQKIAEAWQGVADAHESNVNDAMLEIHEQLWMSSQAHKQQQALFETHKSALALYEESTTAAERGGIALDTTSIDQAQPTAQQVATRCEDVLNVTMSEMDRIHTERIQEWSALSRDMLDEQIERYESVLAVLRDARSRIDEVMPSAQSEDLSRAPAHERTGSATSAESKTPVEGALAGPILPSPYESQLYAPHQPEPLAMPDMELTVPTSVAALATRPVDTFIEWINGGHAH